MNLLSVKEVAELLDSHRETVYKLIRSGELPALKLGKAGKLYRIKREDVDRLLHRNE